MNAKTVGYLCALGATLIWSGNFVVSRAVAFEIPPISLNFLRWLVALVCVAPLALPKLRADLPVIRRHWRYLSVMALVGITVMNTLVYKAGQTSQSLTMALMVPTTPMMIIVLARIFHGEAITPRRLLGIGVVLTGVLIVVTRGDFERLAQLRLTPGDFWALGGAACFAVYSLQMRCRPEGLSLEGFNAATYLLGLLFSIPILVWEVAVLGPPQCTSAVVTGVLYTGVGCSFAAFQLWGQAIATIGPVRSGFVYYSLPVFAAIASAVLLDEAVTGAHVIGGALILTGILTATTERRVPDQIRKNADARPGRSGR